ncbi:indole-3-glycerol phosphate synthase TrpC [Companilactobacillus allii]|uniref:Indole-3-glycerol phosphate synthase n=1 Tax=Companilactobacillus allii TaxID=1847728 RepID=A0A1P8Q3C8_9LACO|nr:indole-3-glycerol phosphate synthase TrpC [Companilactobacillus allii]APX72346.1 indole-3-glycerol phosphate synthase [Companilactobacillus allii]USQ69438.1 indole-3-glycerol phosphate synthase TrpC [Companilactobacillus allii]
MILDDLVESTKKRIADEKSNNNIQEIIDKFLKSKMGFIGEVKHASPSKGEIVKDFPYIQIAKEYSNAGIDAISVLTEPTYFQGKLEYLSDIAKNVDVPVLRKDFVIDPYMIYQAKFAGAKIILLIVSILTPEKLKQFQNLANELDLAAIVEVHSTEELQIALDSGARIIGVNNRNLKDFTVDLNNSLKLRPLVPSQIPFIAESGIKTVEDIKLLKAANINEVLIGETFMKAEDKSLIIREFKEA